jgi:cyclophilin family peptidyl-prolyl cis-trans isomerase
MTVYQRLSLVAALVVILAIAASSASAVTTPPYAANLVAQNAATPDEICAAADHAEPENRAFSEAEQVLEDGVDYGAVICTAAGAIYLDLYEDQAPVTVNNFVFLAQNGFYNNTTFHRVIPGFMAQGGDPLGTGTGGPGYQFADEVNNGLVFDEYGLLAMANSGPDTNGSQFFITTSLPSHLDGLHTVFGKVTQGIDVAELLTPRDPQRGPAYAGDALETIVIIDDPAMVAVTPDLPPSVDHLQTILEKAVTTQIIEIFTLDEGASRVYDLDAEAGSWQSSGGNELVAWMRAYLSEREFGGTASVLVNLTECPANPGDLPIWSIQIMIADFSGAEAAEAVVFDDARSAALVDHGAFAGYVDPAEFPARVYHIPAANDCGDNGTLYRLEFPYGRYILATDLVLDGDFVTMDTQPSATQLLVSVLQELLYNSVSGVLDRGNAAAAD